ncbi:unnamed protein product, partial [marine sediment metagenome]
SMNCQFSNPVNLSENAADWEYQVMDCQFSEDENPVLLVDSTNTSSTFYLSKTVSYADIWLMFIFSVVITFVICEKIAKFIFSEK